ncbi:hypothetical protein DEH81_15015 [Pectobacterium zantedeschiae]|nr:hypothetical protein DEH81_15015 [Pectobacterium zantedeschiae]
MRLLVNGLFGDSSWRGSSCGRSQYKAIELRDTVVPSFLYKITPAGRKVYMLQYRIHLCIHECR